MNERNKKYKNLMIAILIVAIVITSIFILIGKSKTEVIKSNITEIITPSYKLATTPYATLVFIGNGTAKVGGIAGIKYLQNNSKNIYNNSVVNYSDIYLSYNNITIDNKTFAIANESIVFNWNLQEIKQNIPLSAFASKNGTLYYIKLINFSNYYGVIIPANFMNNSDISLPFTITPYPSCPIIPAVSNPNDIVFNNFINNNSLVGFGTSNIYTYTGVIILKNTTGIVGNKQYPLCYSYVETIRNSTIIPAVPSQNSCVVNDEKLNCTYLFNYTNIVNEIPVFPKIKIEGNNFIENSNGTFITGLNFGTIVP